jgi:protein-S-isoprenylcysteine O-methyltransferase Ste14
MAHILRHLFAIILLPVMVTVIVPSVIIVKTAGFKAFWQLPASLNSGVHAVGFACCALGVFLVVRTVSLFALAGKGTLAPWDPPQKLVVRGVYQYVRNPMVTGVFLLLLGEALLFSSPLLLGWCLIFLVPNLLYIPFVEERGLERRFGDAYRAYKRYVPRWIPRIKPWTPPE